MKVKKIAIVTPYGGEPRFDNFAEFILALGLTKLGFDIRFYTYQVKSLGYKDCLYRGIKVIRCGQKFGLSPRLFFSFLKFKPQVVIFFHPRSNLSFTAYLASRLVRAKIISEIVGILHDPFIVEDRDNPHFHLKKEVKLITNFKSFFKELKNGPKQEIWQNLIYHLPTAKADVIVAINKDEQAHIKNFYQRSSELIYWCISQESITTEKKPDQILPPDYILFIGQNKKRKGWDTIIDALAILKKQNITKNLIFVSPNPESEMQEIKEYIKNLNLESQITFLRLVTNEEKNWLYHHCQYVAVPSRYEGFGLPVFEAFKAKKPVLATDIPVFLEFLEHKKNAMISKIGDGYSLAENIKELDNDQTLVNHLIDGGEKTATEYNEEVMIKKFIALIERFQK